MIKKIIINAFSKIFDQIIEFCKILFYREEKNPKELPSPLKKYTITAIFPSRDIMDDAMKYLR